jgi:hypothetical protein
MIAGISGRTRTDRTKSSKCCNHSGSLFVSSFLRGLGSRDSGRNLLWIGSIEFQNDQISLIGHMVTVTICVISRIGFLDGSIGKFIGGVGEDCIPPIEKFVWVTAVSDWIVSCTCTCRDCCQLFFQFDNINRSASPDDSIDFGGLTTSTQYTDGDRCPAHCSI